MLCEIRFDICSPKDYYDTKGNPHCEGKEIMQGLNSAPVSFDYAYTGVPSKDTTRATAQTPDDAEAYNLRGIAYSENGDQDRAIATFSKAIELKPDFAEAYNNRGIAYGEKGEYNLAIEDYNKTIQLKPNRAEAYNNRGAAYINKGEIDRAIKDCSKAIELNSDFAKAYTIAAWLTAMEKIMTVALKTLTKR